MPEPMERGNPDAGQDRALIQSVLQEELAPVFEVIASRFKSLEGELAQAKDLLMKFSFGIIDTADQHRRSTLSDMISSKYGADIEPFDGFYKDTMGKGFSDSLIEELMGQDGMPDDTGLDQFMQGKLGEARGKFGKYLGMPVAKETVVSVKGGPNSGEESAHEEIEKGAEKAAEEGAPEAAEEVKKGLEEDEGADEEMESGDSISRLMKEMQSMRGQKHSLSGRKAKKKEE